MPPFGLIAADTNGLLSAAVGGVAVRLIHRPEISLVTTDANIAEVKRHVPKMADKYGLDLDLVASHLARLPVRVYGPDEYGSHLEEAAGYLSRRDPDDIPLLALVLKLRIPIWTNDKDFEVAPVTRYTTAQLLTALGL